MIGKNVGTSVCDRIGMIMAYQLARSMMVRKFLLLWLHGGGGDWSHVVARDFVSKWNFEVVCAVMWIYSGFSISECAACYDFMFFLF